MGHANQGIVHIIGPEQGLTQPGMTIVCGDSHTSTHGAFGALAFGIGTSEVEHVLATQTLPQRRPAIDGRHRRRGPPRRGHGQGPGPGHHRHDRDRRRLGHIIEYRGSAITGLSMEGRMTVCNMSIEAGARAGMIAPDDTTFAYLEGRDHAPKGAAWEAALADWRSLPTDDGATFDKEVHLDAATLAPYVTWGTNPAQVTRIDGSVPDPAAIGDDAEQEAADRALEYMGLEAGTPIHDIAVDTVFIGSCTNGRIEDLRAAAAVLRGRKVRPGPAGHGGARAPTGSGPRPRRRGSTRCSPRPGFEWREPGCSMCLAMNPDKLAPGERAASTSNRNFEGRQGRGGRTHLVSPAVAAATAVAGHFATPEELD